MENFEVWQERMKLRKLFLDTAVKVYKELSESNTTSLDLLCEGIDKDYDKNYTWKIQK